MAVFTLWERNRITAKPGSYSIWVWLLVFLTIDFRTNDRKIKKCEINRDNVQDDVIEALRRSKFKFSGRQKIYVSKNHGFTKWTRDEYVDMKADGRLQNDGVNVKYFPEHGPLSRWCKTQAALAGVDC